MNFALLGHQEHWEAISSLLESGTAKRWETATLKEIYPWLPPRILGKIRAQSCLPDCNAEGCYVETFISPDDLAQARNKSCLAKLRRSAEIAAESGAKVAALGGFTSIALEGDLKIFEDLKSCAFTTGNTLTTALIVKGIEEAARRFSIELRKTKVLVVGSGGDIGSACARYFAPKAESLLLCGRHSGRLREQAQRLSNEAFCVRYSCDLDSLLPQADLVIFAASLTGRAFSAEFAKEGAILCDAGYPKNCLVGPNRDDLHYFYGGMGRLQGGYSIESAFPGVFDRYPAPGIAHGCLLEAVLLALDAQPHSLSVGRGNISPENIEAIWSCAGRHGLGLAPFYNGKGLWNP